MKRVLLTGASHGLGRTAFGLLQQQNTAVRAVARHTQALQDACHLSENTEVHSADLTQLSATHMAALVQDCGVVWHCAALSSPWGKYADFHATNVEVTRQLAEAAGQAGVNTFVHISTPSLYFDFQTRLNVPETHRAQRFANHYAHTKWLAEVAIQDAVQRYPNTRFVLLRPRAIFGEHDRVLVPRLLQLWQQGKGAFKLPRGGEVLMDLTYAPNVVHAMGLASENTHIASGSVFNITNQEPWQLQQVLAALFAELQQDYRIKAVPYAVVKRIAAVLETWANVTGDEPMLTRYSAGTLAFDLTLDNHKAQEVLGYRPQTDMATAIANTARSLKV